MAKDDKPKCGTVTMTTAANGFDLDLHECGVTVDPETFMHSGSHKCKDCPYRWK